jgi:epsilon-lactone hydrolase
MKKVLLTISICSALVFEYIPVGQTADSAASNDGEKLVTTSGAFKRNDDSLPPSSYLSGESQRRYQATRAAFPFEPLGLENLFARAKSAYPAKIEDVTIGGIRAKLVSPKNEIPARNSGRVLINVHGGGFRCSELEQLLESIPIASVTRIKVVSVNYRCDRGTKYPAATEDVTSVYKFLLAKYAPHNVGIYGCSAGGILTAQTIAWLQKMKLPTPGAIGLFCGADAVGGGDSMHMWGRNSSPLSEVPYLADIDRRDPLASPTLYSDRLKEFPSTLLVIGSRDYLGSSVIVAHANLVKAGVYTELHVWEGMGHGFFMDVDMPESKEMYSVTANFFNTRLGQ